MDRSSAARILGIDPGLNVTGYGLVETGPGGVCLVEAGVVRSSAKRSLAARVLELHQGIVEIIDSLRPTAVAIEELYSHYERPRTAILMGHARGMIVLAAAAGGVPQEIHEVRHLAGDVVLDRDVLAGEQLAEVDSRVGPGVVHRSSIPAARAPDRQKRAADEFRDRFEPRAGAL